MTKEAKVDLTAHAHVVEDIILGVKKEQLIGLRSKRKSDGQMVTLICVVYVDDEGEVVAKALAEAIVGDTLALYENPSEYMTPADEIVCSMLAHYIGYEAVGAAIEQSLNRSADNDQKH